MKKNKTTPQAQVLNFPLQPKAEPIKRKGRKKEKETKKEFKKKGKTEKRSNFAYPFLGAPFPYYLFIYLLPFQSKALIFSFSPTEIVLLE